ncbi:MAG TPA: RHS repeat-associated core domain-containing protein [Thermoanaerobaculia bacterium]|nr:RHS repeat-associated core domain-containing protein [Thermoanaerobaculia bacterium]
MRSALCITLLLAALLLAAAPLSAQVYPALNKGLRSDGSYASGGLDTVSTFNGSLTISIPLGQSYPVGGGLSYGLGLSFNGRTWDYEEVDNGSGQVVQAWPARRSNAGIGWTVSLGQLLPPSDASNDSGEMLYVSPSGSEHALYKTLHEGDPEDAGDSGSTQNVRYSRDGTYLRLKAAGGGEHDLEMADGTVHRFDNLGRLKRIRNRFGTEANPANKVDVTYFSDRWELTDSHGRVQKVWFTTQPGANDIARVVQRVELTKFGGGLPATYTFGYSTQSLQRACRSSTSGIGATVAVPLLTSLTLPDGSRYAADVADYHVTTSPEVCWPGSLKRLRLPTLGYVAWAYQQYSFPQEGKNYRYLVQGVHERKLLSETEATLGTWTYQTELLPPPPGATKATDLKNTLTDPSGNKRISYFTVAVLNQAGRTRIEYGLPYTRATSHTSPWNGVPMYLSSEVIPAGRPEAIRSTWVLFEVDQKGPAAALTHLQNRNRRLVRSRTLFDDDEVAYPPGSSTLVPVEAEEIFSDFDGLGHYRSRRTEGSFQAANVRVETTRFNPSRGRYEIDPATDAPTANHTFTMLAASSPWVMNTYDLVVVDEPQVEQEKTLLSFDAATGFLTCQRTIASRTSMGATDVLVVWTADAAGNPATESWWGGDGASLPTGSTCATGAGNPVYRVDRTFSSGVLSKSQQRSLGTLAPFYLLDLTIDNPTGLPSASRDVAGVATSFSYDSMGRPTVVAPAGEAQTETSYSIASFTGPTFNPAKVHTLRRTASPNVTYEESQLFFDSQGRLIRERRKQPDGTWNRRERQWDNQGRPSGISTLQTDSAPLQWTYFQDYDAFGRPGRILPPDGAGHDVELTYAGAQKAFRKVWIADSGSAGVVTESEKTFSQIFDRQGRVYRVRDPLYGGTESIEAALGTTTYLYDSGSRLRQVQQEMGEGVQVRNFSYDGRGFLVSEQHPEKGAVANGFVTYGSFDPKGRPRTRTDGTSSIEMVYDGYERLTLIKEAGPTGRTLKTFAYAATNAAPNQRLGKLETAERWQYLAAPDGNTYTARVIESYVYSGLGGRISSRDTDVRLDPNSPGYRFTQSFTYHPLGIPETMGYPRCTAAFATCADDPGTTTAPTVAYGYTQGYLTSVVKDSLNVATISYHPNGLVAQVAHANLVSDVIGNDPTGLPRPSVIGTSNAVTNWTTGAFAYDGVGNIKTMGGSTGSWFLYDGASRLKEAHVKTAPSGTGAEVWQTYSYDGFGNLLSTTGTIGRSTPTSAASNRLASATYNDRGSMTAWNGNVYKVGALEELWNYKSGAEDWYHAYTADDERVLSVSWNGGFKLLTLRDLDGKVLREYKQQYVSGAEIWSVERDYLYRGSQLLAAETPQGRRHFHLDHLGTPRLITDINRQQLAYHVYYPYGEEATAWNQDTEQMKFTGHERDFAGAGGAGDDLDYMHARYFGVVVGRFNSLDPIGGRLGRPQSWNRYAYVLGNPLKYTDPYGLEPSPLQDYYYGYGVFGASTSGNYYSTNDPLNQLMFGTWTWEGLSYLGEDVSTRQRDWGLLDVARARQFYEQKLEEADSTWGIFFLETLLDILPETQEDLGVELVLSVVPGPLDNAAYKGVRLLGKNARPAATRINTDLPGGRATAKSIFRNLTKGQSVRQKALDSGGVRRFTSNNSVTIRLNPDGTARIDLKRNGIRETIRLD